MDVSQRLSRSHAPTKSLSGCQTPNGCFWDTHRMRMALGIEKLRCTGWFVPTPKEQDVVLNNSFSLLGNLAGNAMTVPQIAAAEFVTFSVFGMLRHACVTGHIIQFTGSNEEASTRNNVLDWMSSDPD